jgi:hypothetical protein
VYGLEPVLELGRDETREPYSYPVPPDPGLRDVNADADKGVGRAPLGGACTGVSLSELERRMMTTRPSEWAEKMASTSSSAECGLLVVVRRGREGLVVVVVFVAVEVNGAWREDEEWESEREWV